LDLISGKSFHCSERLRKWLGLEPAVMKRLNFVLGKGKEKILFPYMERMMLASMAEGYIDPSMKRI
jgi:hypothetical protein